MMTVWVAWTLLGGSPAPGRFSYSHEVDSGCSHPGSARLEGPKWLPMWLAADTSLPGRSHRMLNTCRLWLLLGQFIAPSDLHLDQGWANLSWWNMWSPRGFLQDDISLGLHGPQNRKDEHFQESPHLPGGSSRPSLSCQGFCLTYYFNSQ